MKNLIYKIIILAFSLVFAALVLTTFAAERLSAMSFRPVFFSPTPDERIELIDRAIKLDPMNAELRFRKFVLLQRKRVSEGKARSNKAELYAMKDAVDLRPLWPKYHLYYGLILEKMSPRPNIVTRQLILSQLKKAAELKPYSSLYQEKYSEYLEKFRDIPCAE
jgi:hypothetical protein